MERTLVFDLDGTLVDSVYQHVLAWHGALQRAGIGVSVWRIHRRIGMSGGLFVERLLRETDTEPRPGLADSLRDAHAEIYNELDASVTPLPGARALLQELTDRGVPWAIATSGALRTAGPVLERLGVPEGVPVVTRDQVPYAKPNPDLFLRAMEKLRIDPRHGVVVGDSVWDLLAARQAGMLGVGVLSGGYGEDELNRAGAYRVYEDPEDLRLHLDELCVGRGT
ncbi:MAG TPA: HAD family hydrolase [Gammaproteobacteria bacterium]|nr:HAD family hydrolase [Gammaproteobacteria bacterium]